MRKRTDEPRKSLADSDWPKLTMNSEYKDLSKQDDEAKPEHQDSKSDSNEQKEEYFYFKNEHEEDSTLKGNI